MAQKRAAPGSPLGSPPAAKQRQLFTGCRVVFWATHLTQIMQQRVKHFGGIVDQALAADSVGRQVVVCTPKMTAKEAAVKLQSWNGPCKEVLVGRGTPLCMPEGVAFVVPDWVSRSIALQELQPVDSFLPPAFAPAPLGAVAAGTPQVSASQQVPEQPSEEQQQQPGTPCTAPGPPDNGVMDQTAVTPQQPASSVVTTELDAEELRAAQDVSQQQLCRVQRRGSEFVAVVGAKPRYTGGSTGIPWGSCGVWDEPYDEAAARRTVEKLRAYHFKLKEVDPEALPSSAEPVALNGVCSHASCAKRRYCLVDKVLERRQTYEPGKDQFQLKALDKLAHTLIAWPKPLDTAEDVDEVTGITAKGAQKVKEALMSETASRLVQLQNDEQHQVVRLFLEVWGTGSATAHKWYRMGLRTLDDVRSHPDIHLNEQQRVCLQHFDDLLQKIPRQHIAQTEALVREACFDLVERWGGSSDVERTYCFATGSYKRGKPASSDIDFLIALPPSLSPPDCDAFLTELLQLLLQRGLLVDELLRKPGNAAPRNHASWMGLCRPPGFPHVARIDVKVYAHEAGPFAVNYFANSEAFCRATRHWANTAVAEVAQRYNPAANGFKISDVDMLPVFRKAGHYNRSRRRSQGNSVLSSDSDADGGSGMVVLQPAVRCTDETSIFRVLGLDYVPVHMRYFHNFA